MSWIMVDVEADGPIPGKYSMISLGAVLVEDVPTEKLQCFKTDICPISGDYIPAALAISGYRREETLRFTPPVVAMENFEAWVLKMSKDRPMFISDNNGFDWMFVCWYFHYFLGRNPFGHSSTNLGSLYKGMVRDMRKNFKHLRKTKHTHDPVDDCKGNVEALLEMKKSNTDAFHFLSY